MVALPCLLCASRVVNHCMPLVWKGGSLDLPARLLDGSARAPTYPFDTRYLTFCSAPKVLAECMPKYSQSMSRAHAEVLLNLSVPQACHGRHTTQATVATFGFQSAPILLWRLPHNQFCIHGHPCCCHSGSISSLMAGSWFKNIACTSLMGIVETACWALQSLYSTRSHQISTSFCMHLFQPCACTL